MGFSNFYIFKKTSHRAGDTVSTYSMYITAVGIPTRSTVSNFQCKTELIAKDSKSQAQMIR